MQSHDKHIDFENRTEKLKFDMHMAFDHNADWFTAQLFRLIAKADVQNRERLRKGFPEEVAVYEEWWN